MLAVAMISQVAVADSPAGRADEKPTGPRVEIRIETVANRDGAAPDSCEAAQSIDAASSTPFALWSALDEGRPVVKGGGIGERERCGSGRYPGPVAPGSSPPPPFLIVDIAANAGWDPGPMDPGPGDAVVLFLTVTVRERNGPSWSTSTTHRSTRLEPGEEQIVPVALDESGRTALGVHEVLLRVRGRWAGREGAVEYGALQIASAAPGSEIRMDGGVAGRAGSDGKLVMATVAAGEHEVELRGVSGPVVSRTIEVMPWKTIPVLPAEAGSGSPPQPVLKPSGTNAEGFAEYRRDRDGVVMVEVPAGEFKMGDAETEGAPLVHTVYVSAFLMDKVPLTVERYRRFAAATGRPLPPDPYWGVHDSDPVSFVRWDEGRAYCEWAGARLPREAEREKATRGTDGRMFAWGSEPPGPERAVFGRFWGEQGNDTAGVRPAGASPYGLLDTSGNMWEYCEDWWDADYFKSSPPRDPAGPRTGRARVVRGGSWDSRWVTLTAARRNFAYTGYREGDFGFRCAADPPR